MKQRSTQPMKTAIFALLLSWLLLAAGPTRAEVAAICNVGGLSPTHATFALALADNSCATINIDEVLTITGSHTITRNLEIKGRVSGLGGGPGVDFNGQNNGRIFSIGVPGLTVTFDHLLFRNANTTGLSGTDAYGGAIRYIYNNGTVTVKNSVFENNRAGGRGGAIYNENTLVVINSEFSQNNAPRGGAIYSYFGPLDVDNATFDNNTASDRGGAIYFPEGSLVSIDQTSFTNNSAYNGGAVYALNVSTELGITDSDFSQNEATANGGALWANSDLSSLTLTNNSFTQNSADINGGAIHTEGNSEIIVTNNAFSQNSAGDLGGAINASGIASITIEQSSFTNNSAATSGGAIRLIGSTEVIVTGSVFRQNQATQQFGGGLQVLGGTLNMDTTTFDSNSAAAGGGLSIPFVVATIHTTALYGNTATEYGSAIASQDSQVTIVNSTISGNNGTDVAAVEALLSDTAQATDIVTLLHTTVINNGQFGISAFSNNNPGVSATAVRLQNSLVAGHTTADCSSQNNKTIDATPGYNLDSDDSCLSSGGTGNATVSDVGLNALADNGGPTQTHFPTPDSPARDQIPVGTNGCGTTTTSDQRGEVRPQHGLCDIGAVELSCAEGGYTFPYDVGSVVSSDHALDLRRAIACANENESPSPTADIITLGADITLSSSLPQISSQITLEGAGYTIDANNLMRHFFVTASGDFTINQTTLQNGLATNGGSIHNRGNVTLTNSTLIANTATGEGGGIYAALTTANSTVRNSTLTDNAATTGGAISNRGTTTVSTSTFSANAASSSGGAVYNRGPFKLTSSTFSGNTAPTGRAIHLFNNTSNFAGNIFAGGNNCAGNGTLNDNGYNVSDDATCTNGGTGSTTNATLNLANLANNGGSTLTHLPGAGSEAIGTIPYGFLLNNGGDLLVCNSSGTDQIGNSRPLAIGLGCTSGAVEAASASLTIIKDASPAVGTDFDFALASEPLSPYSGSTTTAPFWTRPDVAGAICTISIHSVRHHVQPFAVDSNGTYTIASVQSYNGYIYLYQDSFNALDQCDNYLNGNDDGGAANESTLSHALEAGRVYFLVTSGVDDADAGTFTNTITRVGGGGNVYALYEPFTLDDAVPDDGDDVAASTTFSVSPGTYTLTEVVASGWGLTGATCTGASGSVSLTDETLSVEVGDGEAVQCTFVNETLCPASRIVTTVAELSGCIALANANESPSPTSDTITLGADINLTSTLPQITSEIALEGADYFINGGNSRRIFDVASTGHFTVNRAILKNGNAFSDDGGGILNAGTLIVTNSTLLGNDGDFGGAIFNELNALLSVSNSTLSGNSASNFGGGIYSKGTIFLFNSTVSGNDAFSGGGIRLDDGTLTATNSTFYGNTSIGGDRGGIDAYHETTLSLAGNIFSGVGNCKTRSTTIFNDNGYNLSDDTTCTNGGTGSVINATLNLGALAYNGGTTLTHLPGAGSDAIGAIPYGTTISNNGTSWTCDQSATDQRGELRPINLGTACTAGAVEVAISICPSWTATTANELYQCIFRANNNEIPSSTADTITLGADITLSTTLPQITSEITLEGAGYAIDGGWDGVPGSGTGMQIFYVAAGGDLTINQTMIQNGVAYEGGGIHNYGGTLTVTNSTFSGNSASYRGGAIANDYYARPLTVFNSTFSGNSASSGGAIYAFAGNVTNSTFFGNSATTGSSLNNHYQMDLVGNLFAGGSGSTNCASDGTFNDNGYNLSDDATCANGGTGSVTNATLNLGALADNGGPTLTHLPGAGSDAIGVIPYGTTISNNGTSWTCDQSGTDQRGELRPIHSGEGCTAGAVENASVQLTLQPSGFFSWLPDRSGSCSESLYRSSTPYVGHTWLTDDPANYDGSGSLTSVAVNYFYYLLMDCGGSQSQSNEVGEFTFAIVPGS